MTNFSRFSRLSPLGSVFADRDRRPVIAIMTGEHDWQPEPAIVTGDRVCDRRPLQISEMSVSFSFFNSFSG